MSMQTLTCAVNDIVSVGRQLGYRYDTTMNHDVGRRSTILVAEDDRLLRSLALEVLQDEGYQAIGADSGTEALAHLRKHPDVELLISDINMPGMNGLDLARLAKAQLPALKTLIISGRERVEAASLPQPGAFLQKPFSVSGLLAIVRHLLSL